MKKFLLTFVILLLLCAFSACARNIPQDTSVPENAASSSCSAQPQDIAGMTFVYEKDGFGSAFGIHLNEDGSMTYYVGALSSYIGVGTWTLEDNILTLTDKPMTNFQYINRFRVEDGALVFLEEDSTNFMYLEVDDGDRFFPHDGDDVLIPMKNP